MTTDDIMALVELYRTAGGREEHWAKQDHLCNAIDQLVNENRSLRYEVDAIAAIKEERDALQASLREAKKLLEAYAQVKAADEARMQQAVMWISLLCEAAGLDPEGTTVEFSEREGGLPPITVSVAGTITALQERLK